MKITYTILVVVVIALVGLAIGWNLKPVEQPVGNVSVGSEYKSITFLATTTLTKLIKNESGTLGQVVINTLGTGNVIFYDATSTLPAQRTIQATTSLRVVGVIDASQAAGNYLYGTSFYDGLIAVFSGTQGTSTLMYR
jgi:hypothetical protein